MDPLYEGLVAHGLIVPVGVPGAFARAAVFEDVLQGVDRLIERATSDEQREVFTFPPVISREVLEKVRFFDSFPHLCGCVYSFFGDEAGRQQISRNISESNPWESLLGMTRVALNPAACYPLYPLLTGTLPQSGRTVTMLNWVFRHEPSLEPTRMQSFRVREFVRVGSAEQVQQWRETWLRRSTGLLQSLGLEVTADVAADPFFGSQAQELADSQKSRRLKFELALPILKDAPATALCSFNFHQAFFGLTFDIRTYDERLANSACVGFGLERLVMALFKTHGFCPARWPAVVRGRLWP